MFLFDYFRFMLKDSMEVEDELTATQLINHRVIGFFLDCDIVAIVTFCLRGHTNTGTNEQIHDLSQILTRK